MLFFAANEAALNGFHEFSHELRLVTGGAHSLVLGPLAPQTGRRRTWYGMVPCWISPTAKKLSAGVMRHEHGMRRLRPFSNTGAWEYDMRNDRLWFQRGISGMIGLDARKYRLQYGEKMQNWIDLMHPETEKTRGVGGGGAPTPGYFSRTWLMRPIPVSTKPFFV